MEPNRKMIEQRPVPPNAWLYEDRGENDRYFTDVVYLPQPDDPTKEPPYWKQCTQAAREEWEEQHKPEPEPEPQPENPADTNEPKTEEV